MRIPFLLTTALVASLSGCTSTQKTVQEPADSVVDDQIAQSATAISLAQLRLHETSAIPPVVPVAAKAVTALPVPSPASPPAQPAGLIVSAIKATGAQTTVATKVFPATPPPAPVTVVAPVTPVVKPVSAPAVKPAVVTTTSLLGRPAPIPVAPPKVIPASPVPSVVVSKAAPTPVQDPWLVSPGDATLRRVLAKWAARAGWQLVWEASVDVPVTVSASFDGDFRSAVKRLFLSLSAADVNLNALMYAGNHVLRVTESGRRAQ